MEEELSFCKCGCGKRVTKKGNKFIRGHNKPFRGRKHTDESKKKISRSLKDPSDEVKKKMSEAKKGEKHPNWKGGRLVDNKGYIRILAHGHIRSDRDGYVLEHIFVWMEHNGDIPDGYCIHHVNGDKSDNRIENLKMMIIGEHTTLHHQTYSDRTVLGWVEMNRYDGLSFKEISKKVNIHHNTIWDNVRRFKEKFPLPEWASHQIYRESGLLENICKDHSVGHPHENWLTLNDADGSKGFSIHGCCGCCCPGMKEAIKKAYEDEEDDERNNTPAIENGQCNKT